MATSSVTAPGGGRRPTPGLRWELLDLWRSGRPRPGCVGDVVVHAAEVVLLEWSPCGAGAGVRACRDALHALAVAILEARLHHPRSAAFRSPWYSRSSVISRRRRRRRARTPPGCRPSAVGEAGVEDAAGGARGEATPRPPRRAAGQPTCWSSHAKPRGQFSPVGLSEPSVVEVERDDLTRTHASTVTSTPTASRAAPKRSLCSAATRPSSLAVDQQHRGDRAARHGDRVGVASGPGRGVGLSSGPP